MLSFRIQRHFPTPRPSIHRFQGKTRAIFHEIAGYRRLGELALTIVPGGFILRVVKFRDIYAIFQIYILIYSYLWPIAGFPGERLETSFGILGDTQQTLWLEKIFLNREDNRFETRTLISHLAQEAISSVIHVGDMVGNGMLDSHWQDFDDHLETLGIISVYPALGNHDYWGFNFIALPKVYKRFPFLERAHWYSIRIGSTAIVFLDSNDDQLSLYDWRIQKSWYESEMKKLNNDSFVDQILIASHHPPFTASNAVGGSKRVREEFLPVFFSTPKATAFFSGHAHGHERYRIGGKLFVITGGGGSPRHGHRTGPSEYVEKSPHPFHYLIANPTPEGLLIQMKGFQKGDSDVRVIDTFMVLQPRKSGL